ncbi:hypothetical protein SUNI508_04580 [Seiridium unicorne]|uniref:Uncharacterized protein n=1 Tax=Seiridium unicorne TaxID=138068 RepID=A0ABR2V7N6_9PEZI
MPFHESVTSSPKDRAPVFYPARRRHHDEVCSRSEETNSPESSEPPEYTEAREDEVVENGQGQLLRLPTTLLRGIEILSDHGVPLFENTDIGWASVQRVYQEQHGVGGMVAASWDNNGVDRSSEEPLPSYETVADGNNEGSSGDPGHGGNGGECEGLEECDACNAVRQEDGFDSGTGSQSEIPKILELLQQIQRQMETQQLVQQQQPQQKPQQQPQQQPEQQPEHRTRQQTLDDYDQYLREFYKEAESQRWKEYYKQYYDHYQRHR